MASSWSLGWRPLEVSRLSAERIAKEQKSRERLRNKELGVNMYGLKAKLLELGVRYVEDEKELEQWVKSLLHLRRRTRLS